MERAPLPRCPQPGLAPAGRVSPAVPTATRGLQPSLPLFWAAHVPRLLPLLGAQQRRGLSPTISAVPMLRLSQLVRSAGAARSPNRSENQSLIYFHDGDARARRCCVCSAVTPIDRRPPSLPRPGGAGAAWPRAGFVHQGALGHVCPAESSPQPCSICFVVVRDQMQPSDPHIPSGCCGCATGRDAVGAWRGCGCGPMAPAGRAELCVREWAWHRDGLCVPWVRTDLAAS